MDRQAKVLHLCSALADVICDLRRTYDHADAPQRVLIETMIGAAIWYLPKPTNAWTGYVSLKALKSFHPDSGVVKPKLSEEHVYPRKVAARNLLGDLSLDHDRMTNAFCEKYGQFHYITPEENKTVQPFQRESVFTTPEKVYEAAGVVLIHVNIEDLKAIKKRNRAVIDRYIPYEY